MIAVKFYGPNSEALPEQWPMEVRELPDGAVLPDGFTAFTPADYEAHMQAMLGQLDAAARNAYVASMQAQEAESARIASTIPQIKAEALRRIVALLGYAPEQQIDWLTKEVNMNARASELLRRQIAGTITAEETAELDSMEAFFAKVKAIRSYSNDLGAQVQAGQQPDIYAGWPY